MSKLRKRKDPIVRRDEILNIAIKLAIKVGYKAITREMIADTINVSPGLITRYFGTVRKLKREIMKTAIEQENLIIIAQGLSVQDPLTEGIKKELKHKVLMFLLT